jgi:hypothetical protein
MATANDYNRINSSFEHSVLKMQESLQYLADNDKVGDKFIAIQNLILKTLIDYQQQAETYISTLEMENAQLASGKIREIDRLKKIKESFEAICIIHGITDFPAWMNKGHETLIPEAIELYKENTIALPNALRQFIDALTVSEREIIENILFINFNKKNY